MRIRSGFVALLLAAALAPVVGCASQARPAIQLYEHGDYAGAARAAESGLAAHPRSDALWGMRVRAALALGDAGGVASAYRAYRDMRGDDDLTLVRDVANATLKQALASPSARMKIAAIRAVERVEIESLADDVGARMGDDDDTVAATAAVAVLRGYGQAPGVADDMLRSEDPVARRIAIEGIAAKVGIGAIAELRTAAVDPDAGVREVALRWLGTLRDAASSVVIIRNLKHPDDGVRAAAVTALGRIGVATHAKTADLVRLATAALADRALAVRLAGVEVLASAHATEALVALAVDPEPLVAVQAAVAVERRDLAAPALERAATAERWTARAGAANAAARALAPAAAIALVTRLATDPELGVRLAAARAMGALGQRDAAIAVFAAASSTDSGAAADLAALGDPRGWLALQVAVRDPAAAPEARAAAAAAHLIAHRITPALVAALADSSGVVRVEAAAALAVLAHR